MALIERRFHLEHNAGGRGLSCTAEGVSLAGVPLLRKTNTGLAPRPDHEIAALMAQAYGRDIDPNLLSPGLEVIARALDQGDLARAMIAALRLKLPELSSNGAIGIVQADEMLAKFDPSEPRDPRGRWTDGGSSQSASRPHTGGGAAGGRRGGSAGRHSGRPPQTPIADQSNRDARLIPVSNPGAANDNFAVDVCLAASRQCQISALRDKERTPYFSACQKAEDVCLMLLPLSRLKPDQPIGVIFPDRTVVMIEDGGAMVTHVGGARLPKPLR